MSDSTEQLPQTESQPEKPSPETSPIENNNGNNVNSDTENINTHNAPESQGPPADGQPQTSEAQAPPVEQPQSTQNPVPQSTETQALAPEAAPSAPSEKSGDALGDLPRETLLGIIKERTKKLNTLEATLKKMEERYVKIYKENKNISKDRDAFEKVLKLVFSDDENRFPILDPGQYEFTMLQDVWTKLDHERNQKAATMRNNLDRDKAEFEKKVKEATEDQIRQISKELNSQIEEQKATIDDLEESNEKLSKEILSLNELLANKNQEIVKLKKAEQELSTLKAEILINDLNSKNKQDEINIQNRFKESERVNEMLKLKNDLERAHERIRSLEVELAQAVPPKIQLESTEVQTDPLFFSGIISEEEIARSKELYEPAMGMSPTMDAGRNVGIEMGIGGLGGMGGNGGMLNPGGPLEVSNGGKVIPKLNEEYLKHVIIKYFVYMARGHYKEAAILEHVILTILRTTKEERGMIEIAKSERSIWTSAKNFLSETLVPTGWRAPNPMEGMGGGMPMGNGNPPAGNQINGRVTLVLQSPLLTP